MPSPYASLVEDIFEQSVVDALSVYGIDVPTRAGDNFDNYNPKRVFLREAVLSKLVYEWTYSPDIRVKIKYDPTTTPPSWDESEVRRLVRDFVKNEIRLETGRMQVDAERKVLENLVEGQYFKKGGVKKFIDNLTAVVSPDSEKFQKLVGTKITSETQDSYRKSVLDVVMPRTAGGVVSEIAKLEKVRGKVDRTKLSGTVPGVAVTPLKPGSTFAKGIVDILDPNTTDYKFSSPYFSEVQRIKKAFDDSVKVKRDEIKKLRGEYSKNLLNPTEIARISSEITRLQSEIKVEFASGTVTVGSSTGSAKDLLETMITTMNSTIVPGSAPKGLVTQATNYYFMDSGRISVGDIWENNPDARLKIEHFTHLRDTRPQLRNYYQGLIDHYTDLYNKSTSLGGTREAFSFKISDDGELEITDRLKGRYDRAVKNFGQGLKFLNVSKEINKYRIETLQVNIGELQTLVARLASKASLTAEEATLLRFSQSLINKFTVHSQSLSLLEGIGRIAPGDPRHAEFERMKNDFITNIDLYESDPTKKAEILAAIRANNRKVLKALMSSGAGQNPYDQKYKKLYEEFYKLGAAAEVTYEKLRARGYSEEFIRDFAGWVHKVSLDNEVIEGFVARRYVENVIYAAQLMTDKKYLKKEIKTLVRKEVQDRLKYFVFDLFPNNSSYGEVVSFLYELTGQQDKKKWLLSKGWSGLLDAFKDRVDKSSWAKNLKEFKALGTNVPIDLIDLLKNPIPYLRGKASFLAWSKFENWVNSALRKRFENLFDLFKSIKEKVWSYGKYVVSYVAGLLQKYGGAIGARLAASLLGLSVPVVGWIVTAVIAIIPILLKPILGDVDLGEALKKILRFVCLLPAIVILTIWLLIIVPIISLFTNVWPTLWNAITKDFTGENLDKSYLKNYNWGGIDSSGSFGNGSGYLTDLVNTSGNTCIREDEAAIYKPTPKYQPRPKHKDDWNNLRVEDFQNLQYVGSKDLNCKIMCNAQIFMLTMYPGINGWVDCNATPDGQKLFKPNGDAWEQKFWCSYTVAKAYRDDFNELDGTAYGSVSALDGWFRKKIGNGIERIDPNTCFNRNKIMSGAAFIMTRDPNCSFGEGGRQHAALFLKFEGNKAVYVNSNSSKIKEETTITDCGNNEIKINAKDYGDGTILYMCSIYQPTQVSGMGDPNRCPTDCVPLKKNY